MVWIRRGIAIPYTATSSCAPEAVRRSFSSASFSPQRQLDVVGVMYVGLVQVDANQRAAAPLHAPGEVAYGGNGTAGADLHHQRGVLSNHMSSSIRCWVLRMGFHCPSSIINRLGRASLPQWGAVRQLALPLKVALSTCVQVAGHRRWVGTAADVVHCSRWMEPEAFVDAGGGKPAL